jgi:PAS domain S-box-containing protein
MSDRSKSEMTDRRAAPEAHGAPAARAQHPPEDYWLSGVPYGELIEQVQDYAIFCTDAAGLATTWNRGVERVLGYEEHEFLGLAIARNIFTPEDVEHGVPGWEMEEAARRGSANNNRWMLKKGGERFFCNGMTTALRDENGALIGYAKVMQDRTMQHVQERELQETTARLTQVNRRKDEFLAVLSHELRNPLAPIRNAVDVLRLAPPGSEPARRAVEAIDRQSAQISRLVDDLLDLSRIGRGKMALQHEIVRVDELARDVAEDHRPAFEQGGIHLEIAPLDEPILVRGDRVRLAQVLGNLLHNARKFTLAGGKVMMRMSRANALAVIEVCDTGIGMDAETLAGVFELFKQATAAGPAVGGGLGLGLALVQGLVELHDGSVEACSDGLGAGTTFVVRLPLAHTGASSARSAPEAPVCAPRRVLIIEDNADMAETLSAALVIRGHDATVVKTGNEGVAAALAHRPDVVLCDIGLPDIAGHEVARRLRDEMGSERPVLIALSGFALSDDVESAIDAGFDRHVAKPPDLDALHRLISGALSASAREG